jgi:hypothetical protein
MTTRQVQAVWELCRQGFPLAADDAEERWSLGEVYQLDLDAPLARSVEALIEQCNWEVRRMKQTTGAAVPPLGSARR